MGSRIARALAGAMISTLVSTLVFVAPITASDVVTATLDGKPISLQRAGTLSCHDFDYPVLRCFSNAGAMRIDFEARLQRRSLQRRSVSAQVLGVADVADVGWVTVYEHASYAGSAMGLSADQPWLSNIGWNDRISSFRSHGAVATFRENSPSGGFVYFFGPFSQVTYVGDYYNDRFSALYIE